MKIPLLLLLHLLPTALDGAVASTGAHCFSTAFSALVSLSGCICHCFTASEYFAYIISHLHKAVNEMNVQQRGLYIYC